MPDYQIAKMWNSETGNGISVLLADNADNMPITCRECKGVV